MTNQKDRELLPVYVVLEGCSGVVIGLNYVKFCSGIKDEQGRERAREGGDVMNNGVAWRRGVVFCTAV